MLYGKGTCIVGDLAGVHVDALMRVACFLHGVQVLQGLDAGVRHFPALAVDERGAPLLRDLEIGGSPANGADSVSPHLDETAR
jgi:hypothetical protein